MSEKQLTLNSVISEEETLEEKPKEEPKRCFIRDTHCSSSCKAYMKGVPGKSKDYCIILRYCVRVSNCMSGQESYMSSSFCVPVPEVKW